ncbi:MAG TPA: alpha/beta hydrolase [Streptosporangiaceae bacterium]|nr:alpha/beta hydrolase [Streptosporangiaceae bacterium]
MPAVELFHGTVHYREWGTGAPVVLLHGYLMGASLWDPVAERLAGEFRVVVPELPFGAHPAPLNPGADLTAAGLGRLVADFLAALGLTGATLVGNDSGAAVAQVVAARHAERLGGLVLATGDAFSNFPPTLFRPLIAAARTGTLTPLIALLKSRPARSLPSAYGWLTHGDLPHDLIDGWVGAYFGDQGVRRDLRRLTAALGDDDFMHQIAAELASFTGPALLAWAADDKFFPVEHARRLAAILPGARVELIEDSRTWVMLDQPDRTARLIAGLAREAAARQAGAEQAGARQAAAEQAGAGQAGAGQAGAEQAGAEQAGAEQAAARQAD